MSYFFRHIRLSRHMGAMVPWCSTAALTLVTATTLAVVASQDHPDSTVHRTTGATTRSPVLSSHALTHCDAAPNPTTILQPNENTPTKIRPGGQMRTVPPHATNDDDDRHHNDRTTGTTSGTTNVNNVVDENEVYYHNLFPLRQLFVPAVEYPLWDENWDERQPSSNTPTSAEEQKTQIRQLRKNGVTRHIILVRHGQYDETHKEDETRILTPLGRDQAHLTGKRIAEMIQGAEDSFGSPCQVKALRVSNLTRAKETAAIIASYLPNTVHVVDPDPMLNEGRPCHTIPGGRMSPKDIETTDLHHPRIEAAFRQYIHRAPAPCTLHPTDGDNHSNKKNVAAVPPESKHEFEIIVCHANVIRYIMCRALQLPPEAWLRFCPFNCSLTYLTIRPTGTVSCRMIGDIGHLPYSASTFSGHHGYNW